MRGEVITYLQYSIHPEASQYQKDIDKLHGIQRKKNNNKNNQETGE